MKRILLYVAALALLVLGGQGTDIGRLRPVELVQVMEQNGLLILETDTGDRGWGLTVDQAVGKLKETTPGLIYLDTADYLLLEEGMEKYLPQLRKHLKKGTEMAYAPKGIDLIEVVEYLSVHKPSRTIGKWEKPAERLFMEGGKINLKNFEEIKK